MYPEMYNQGIKNIKTNSGDNKSKKPYSIKFNGLKVKTLAVNWKNQTDPILSHA